MSTDRVRHGAVVRGARSASRSRARWLSLLVVAPTLLLPAPTFAQAVRTLDEGSFDISIGGKSVGHETFVVRREGTVVKAVGVVSLDSARAPFVSQRVWLQTDSAFHPTLFQLRPRSGDVQNIVARRDGTRLRLQTTSEEGNRSRQFVASAAMAILEPGFAHEYYVFFREHAALGGEDSWSAPVIVPSLGEQATIRVRTAGPDSVVAAGRSRAATRYELTLDGEQIQVWLDGQGRVLKVDRPDHQWTATRSTMTR
jgi:hypothetical protein